MQETDTPIETTEYELLDTEFYDSTQQMYYNIQRLIPLLIWSHEKDGGKFFTDNSIWNITGELKLTEYGSDK